MGNVVQFKMPSHKYHREVTIAAASYAIGDVVDELAGLLKNTPYPMGAPDPTGSLSIIMPLGKPYSDVLRLRFSLGIFHHGAFSTVDGHGLMRAMEDTQNKFNMPPESLDLMQEVFAYISTRGYRLVNSHSHTNPEPGTRCVMWDFQPRLFGLSHERIELSAKWTLP